MTYKLAICDDEPSVIEYVSSIVTDWANEYHYDIQLRIFSSAESFLFSYEDENDYDILKMIHGKQSIILLNKSDLDMIVTAEKVKKAYFTVAKYL